MALEKAGKFLRDSGFLEGFIAGAFYQTTEKFFGSDLPQKICKKFDVSPEKAKLFVDMLLPVVKVMQDIQNSDSDILPKELWGGVQSMPSEFLQEINNTAWEEFKNIAFATTKTFLTEGGEGAASYLISFAGEKISASDKFNALEKFLTEKTGINKNQQKTIFLFLGETAKSYAFKGKPLYPAGKLVGEYTVDVTVECAKISVEYAKAGAEITTEYVKAGAEITTEYVKAGAEITTEYVKVGAEYAKAGAEKAAQGAKYAREKTNSAFFSPPNPKMEKKPSTSEEKNTRNTDNSKEDNCCGRCVLY